jgi:hypothetical protein
MRLAAMVCNAFIKRPTKIVLGKHEHTKYWHYFSSHYRTLLRLDNEAARQWYMNEAATKNWSSRAQWHQKSNGEGPLTSSL